MLSNSAPVTAICSVLEIVVEDAEVRVVVLELTDLGRDFGSWTCSCLAAETPVVGSYLDAVAGLGPAFLAGSLGALDAAAYS